MECMTGPWDDPGNPKSSSSSLGGDPPWSKQGGGGSVVRDMCTADVRSWPHGAGVASRRYSLSELECAVRPHHLCAQSPVAMLSDPPHHKSLSAYFIVEDDERGSAPPQPVPEAFSRTWKADNAAAAVGREESNGVKKVCSTSAFSPLLPTAFCCFCTRARTDHTASTAAYAQNCSTAKSSTHCADAELGAETCSDLPRVSLRSTAGCATTPNITSKLTFSRDPRDSNLCDTVLNPTDTCSVHVNDPSLDFYTENKCTTVQHISEVEPLQKNRFQHCDWSKIVANNRLLSEPIAVHRSEDIPSQGNFPPLDVASHNIGNKSISNCESSLIDKEGVLESCEELNVDEKSIFKNSLNDDSSQNNDLDVIEISNNPSNVSSDSVPCAVINSGISLPLVENRAGDSSEKSVRTGTNFEPPKNLENVERSGGNLIIGRKSVSTSSSDKDYGVGVLEKNNYVDCVVGYESESLKNDVDDCEGRVDLVECVLKEGEEVGVGEDLVHLERDHEEESKVEDSLKRKGDGILEEKGKCMLKEILPTRTRRTGVFASPALGRRSFPSADHLAETYTRMTISVRQAMDATVGNNGTLHKIKLHASEGDLKSLPLLGGESKNVNDKKRFSVDGKQQKQRIVPVASQSRTYLALPSPRRSKRRSVCHSSGGVSDEGCSLPEQHSPNGCELWKHQGTNVPNRSTSSDSALGALYNSDDEDAKKRCCKTEENGCQEDVLPEADGSFSCPRFSKMGLNRSVSMPSPGSVACAVHYTGSNLSLTRSETSLSRDDVVSAHWASSGFTAGSSDTLWSEVTTPSRRASDVDVSDVDDFPTDRRESSYSVFTDEDDCPLGNYRCWRTPSVVVSDHSDDPLFASSSVTLEEIERFRAEYGRRQSAAGDSSSDCSSWASGVSALDADYALRTPERKASDCSTCSTLSGDEDPNCQPLLQDVRPKIKVGSQ